MALNVSYSIFMYVPHVAHGEGHCYYLERNIPDIGKVYCFKDRSEILKKSSFLNYILIQFQA